MAKTQRLPLSTERVLEAALELADSDGIDALSMRRLGQHLGVEAMSLYNHVANKDEVIDGILELVTREFGSPDPDEAWKEGIRASAISMRDALLAHPWAAGIINARSGAVGEARLRQMDDTLGTLRRAGFSAELAHHAFHVLSGHVVGYTMQQLSFDLDDEELERLAADFVATLDADAYPHLAEHVRGHAEAHYGEESDFEFGLDLILDGFERLLD